MTLEARISTTWKRRFALLTVFAFAMGLWFFYDGLVAWPKNNEAYREYVRLEEAGRAAEWPEFSLEHGYPKKPPEKEYGQDKLNEQFFLGGAAMVAGLALAAWMVVSIRRKLTADEEAVHGVTGKRVAFDWIRAIDLRKWETKGIAVIRYEHDGRRGKLLLDDYKYAGAEAILDRIKAYKEAHAPKP